MAKKNALFFSTGPRSVAANWFWLNAGFFCRRVPTGCCEALRALKKSRASNTLLRRYSYAEPWNWFVPPFVVTFTSDPGLRPFSAEYGLVDTLNSWMASTDVRAI